MSWLSSLAPIVGTGLGALFAAPTGGMSMAMGSLIGGLAGTGISSALSASEAVDAQKAMNTANIASAKDTNAMAIELANTAHQREVADLKAAGLNPILSSKYGGSVTPSLTVPQGESLAPTILNSAKQTQDVTSTGFQLAQQAMLQKQQISLTSAQAVKTGLEAQKQAMENDLIAKRNELEKYKLGERYKSRSWDLMLDDINRGVSALNPFGGGSSKKGFNSESINF